MHKHSLKELASAWLHLDSTKRELESAARRLQIRDPLGHLPKVLDAIKRMEELMELVR